MLFIKEAAVARLLDEKKAFSLAERVFRRMAAGKARMPPKIYLHLESGDDFRAMPGYVGGEGGGCGLKWVSVFPKNPRSGLPTVRATVLLNSSQNGELLAVLEANTITASRTAAAAAVATHYLGPARPRKLALVGAGLQARYQLMALTALHSYETISVWGAGEGETGRFCRRFRPHFGRCLQPAPDVRSCVQDADVIVTSTPSRRPLVFDAWVKKGAHINAIGADAKGKQELHPGLLLRSKVVVDEREQAWHSGEINVPVARGLFKKKHLYAELSDVVAGKKKGRASAEETTVFDSTGLAVLDIFFAAYVYEKTK